MKNDNFLDKCIKFVFISIFVFTALMIVIFCIYGCTPDVLIQYFFIYVVGEFLSCALIKTVKVFTMNRDAETEDRQLYADERKTDGQDPSLK